MCTPLDYRRDSLKWKEVDMGKSGDNNHNALYRDEIVKEQKLPLKRICTVIL